MKKKKIFLLDAMALIYKYYFVFLSRPLVTSKGETVGAIYGFLNFVFSILEKEKPDYIAVAFDNKEPTFRHKLFPEYKATRQKIPEDLIPQTEKIKDIVKCLNITLLEFPGYEADDIIGTLAKNISLKGVDVFCVTSDKDYFQLIDHNIKIYKPGKTGNDVEIITENEVKEKYNLSVNQLIDFFALMGDPTDNIPGVPGVGEKTALSLLQEWGSLDNIYNNLEKINKKSIYEKLKSNKELAYLSRELVKINVNVPLKIDLSELELKDYDTEKLSNYFKELEFKSLEKRLTPDIKENINSNNFENNDDKLKEENINSIKKNYHLVKNLNEIDKIVQDIIKKKFFSYDLETTSIEPLNAEIVGIAISFEEKTGYYIPVLVENIPETNIISLNFTPQKKDENLLPVHTVLEKLKCILEDEKIKKIGQNIKYDMLVTSRYGITIKGIGFDSMVASYILDPDSQHNLEALAKRYLNYKMIPISDLIGSGKNQKNMKDIDINLVSNYACEDADIALRLKPILEKELEKNGMNKLCYEVEFPLINVLFEMERVGVLIDTKFLKKISENIEKKLNKLETDIYDLAGEKFNINSTKQLQNVLFEKLRLISDKKTKTGQSTDVSVLEDLKFQHPIAEKLLDYRQLTKLKSTYIDVLPKLINRRSGRIHTSYNQTIVSTGRLSSSNPNLQNIPIRTEIGKEIRKAFIPEKGYKIFSADYSQIELRIMAEITQDENLINAFLNDEDIHSSTASKIFGVSIKDVTSDMRRKAKEINFGIMYGIGPFGLKTRLEISQSEAKKIIDNYFIKYPGIKKYMENTINEARMKGYVTTLLGRRRYFKNINSKNNTLRQLDERAAINMPIQGTAAEMIKIAMVNIQKEIEKNKLKSRMIIQVHDELVFEIYEKEIEIICPIIENKMKTALNLKVPIKVDTGIGDNWYESHK
ncbi:MAG TPA: DNA polymerase I [Ignavibacteria bacterium]